MTILIFYNLFNKTKKSPLSLLWIYNMKYSEPYLFDQFLISIYRFNNRLIRKIIRKFILRREGAEFYSESLRNIFSNYHNITVGLYSYGSFDSELSSGTVVGRYTSIAKNFTVINGSHPVANKSSHPFFYNPSFGYVNKLLIVRRNKLIIGNDVYIGLNVTLLPSVTYIGDGAVIAAGTVVVKDVPPYAIVGGNPGKIIKYRFTEKKIKELLKSEWWLKSIDDLKDNSTEFLQFLKPIKKYDNND